MAAFGLQTHIEANRRKSIALLILFPVLVGLSLLALGLVLAGYGGTGLDRARLGHFLGLALPLAALATAIWFAIAFAGHQALIDAATGAEPADPVATGEAHRLLENLCISRGMTTPALKVIDSPALNAFASGLSEKAMSITLTTGLIEALTPEELEAVLAHELTHIRNGDVRLVVIAAIFVGVAAFVAEMLFRSIGYVNLPRSERNRRSGGGDAALLIIAGVALAGIAYLLSVWARFALSRRREYLADAGSVELTKNPDAMVTALVKVSGRSEISGAPSAVAELFLDHEPRGLDAMFATHPSIDDRIAALRRFAGARAPEAAAPASPHPASPHATPPNPWTRPDPAAPPPNPWTRRAPR